MYKVVAPLYSPVFSDFLKSVDTDTLLNPSVSPILPVTGEKSTHLMQYLKQSLLVLFHPDLNLSAYYPDFYYFLLMPY